MRYESGYKIVSIWAKKHDDGCEKSKNVEN